MVYRFTFISDEVDDFRLVIDADPETTFFELHKTLLESVKYEEGQMTSFFMCNDDWEKEQEITLIEMESSSEYDNLTMDSTKLEELFFDEKQKVLYVFDPLFERAFFGELSEIKSGSVDSITCVKVSGTIPEQYTTEDAIETMIKDNGSMLDDDFYGEDGYNEDELSDDGYGDMNFDDSSLF